MAKVKYWEKTYYHGTSTYYNIEDFLVPTSKVDARTAFKKCVMMKHSKVRITTDLDLAKYHAIRSAEQVGGEPVVYVVKPEFRSLTQITKTDYLTVSADVVDSIFLNAEENKTTENVKTNEDN